MPVYSYICKSCKNIQDEIHGIGESAKINCNECRSTNLEQYFGFHKVAIHGFTTFEDPRGGKERLTQAQIKEVEKKEGLTYLSHDEHDFEIKKNKRAKAWKQHLETEKKAEELTKTLAQKGVI